MNSGKKFPRAERQAFAEEVRGLLSKQGGLDPYTSEAIMQAAGPGRAVAAVNWLVHAVQVIESRSEGSPDVLNDAMGCVLARFGWKWGLGDYRGLPVLEALGFPLPPSQGAIAFRRLMAGAKVALRHGMLKDFLALKAQGRIVICETYGSGTDALCYRIKPEGS